MDGADRHTKEKNTVSCVFDKMVMPMRLELTRVAHYPLKVACLPFHHGIIAEIIIQYFADKFQ